MSCSALGQPHLKCWGSFEHHHTEDIKLFRGCPEEAMGLVRGLERKLYEEQLRALGLLSLEERTLRSDLTGLFIILLRSSRAEGQVQSSS